MPKATIYAYSSKANEEGVPLYIRITHKGDRARMSLGTRVSERQWNEDKSRLSASADNATLINSRLSRIQSIADKAIAQLQAQGLEPKPGRVKEHLQAELNGKDADRKEGFVEFSRRKLQGYKDRGQIGTWKAYRAIIDKFADFVDGEIACGDVTLSLLRDWRTWMYEVRDNKPNTVGKALKTIRTFYRKAQSEGLIDRQRYPFDDITIDSEDSEKSLPTMEDLERLKELHSDLDPADTWWPHLSYFLSAYYAGGMRFGDVAWLEWGHLPGWPEDGARIKYRMGKTSKVTALPVVDGLRKILEHYDHRRENGIDRVFPILDKYDLSDEPSRNQAKKTANALTNKYLSEIADHLDIDHLSVHMSRNLAAYTYYQSTGDVRKTSKMLGHSSIAQTEEYLKGFGIDLDDSFRDAFG